MTLSNRISPEKAVRRDTRSPGFKADNFAGSAQTLPDREKFHKRFLNILTETTQV